ncbi:MAG TPA: Ig-like domain-containing protein [Longimicrobiaceae bacterium]
MRDTRTLRFAAALFATLIGACELATESGDPKVASIRVVPPTATVTVDASVQLSAMIEDDSGNPLEGTVHWASEDEAVATVSAAGNVTGVAPGSVRVAASAGGISSLATIQVEPKPVATVTVSPADVTLTVGETEQLEATPRADDGTVLTDRAVAWSSKEPTIVEVNEDGIVTAIAAGSATVTATSEGKTGSATITVNPKPVATVEVSPAGVALLIGETRQFQARALASDGSVLTGRTVAWSSSAPSIVAISGTGLATARAAGTATIRATIEGRVGTAAVAVSLAPVASVEVTPSSATLEIGKTQTLEATTRAADGTILNGRTVVWTSDDESVATVTSAGLIRGVGAGEATITATSEGKTGSATVTVVPKPVATVTVSPDEATLTVGATQQLTATLRGADGSTLSGRTVTWSSSDEAAATVDGTGQVTAVTAGKATITARSEGRSGTATITVTPKPVASVEISPSAATLLVGETRQFEARALANDGSELTGRAVTWSSSAPNIVEISNTGLATARAAGTATIRATIEGRVGTAAVAVGVQPVATVEVTPTNAALEVGQTRTFQATTRAANGAVLTGRAVAWSSSDETVATVTSAGLVRGVGPGEATISATSEGKRGTATVTVNPKPVATVSVSPDEATLTVGATQQLNATLRAGDGSVLNGRAVAWSSSDEDVATVDNSGRVTAVAAGKATITARSEGRSGTATITVIPKPVATVEVSPDGATLLVGEKQQFRARALASDGSELTGRPVTWSSSDPDIVEISSTGLATALAAGAATIRATIEGRVGTAGVAVGVPPVASVEVVPTTFTLEVDETRTLEAITRAANGSELTGRTVVWTSDDEAVARVSSEGVVRAMGPGATTITASSEGRNGTATVTVVPKPVATVSISPDEATLMVGETRQLSVTLRASDGTALNGRAVAWSSDSPNVARVSDTGLVTALGPGEAQITASSEGRSGTATITVAPRPVESVEVSPSSATLQVGETLQFTARALAQDGSELAGRAVTWSSSASQILEVSEDGLATAHLLGAATVRATIEGKVGNAGVAVIPRSVASVEITPASLSLEVGDSTQLEATALDDNGSELPGRAVEWSTSDEAIATVSTRGLVRGVASGEATITATSEGRSGTASITVAPRPVATVAVRPSADTLFVGESASFTAETRAANGDLLTGRPVEWSSSDESVATVDDGVVTALSAGTTTINASSEGRSGTASLGVLLPPARLIIVSGNGQIGRNNQALPQPLVVQALDTNNAPVPGVTVRWGADNGSITPTEARTGSDGTTSAAWTLGAGSPLPRQAWAEITGLPRVEFTVTLVLPLGQQ